MFQSTPDLVNRENAGGRLIPTSIDLFQSTPDLVNRENYLSRMLNSIVIRFNPLPI